VGRLSSQVKPMPQSNVSRPEHRPPQRPRVKKNAREALSNLYGLIFLVWGPTGHVTQSWM
jgi:hypothetical protein